MKASENYKSYAKEAFISGVVLLVMGVVWLTVITVISILGIEMKIGWIPAAALSLIFFGGSAWAILVEYRDDKNMQKELEKEEAQEEIERQRQLTATN